MEKEPFRDDNELVDACIKKDLAAWSFFIKKYAKLIAVSIHKRLKYYGAQPTLQEIEDIRQNCLASIWKEGKLKSVKNRRNITYWLAIVSGNEAVEYMRRKRATEPAKMVSLYDKIDEKELIEFMPSSEASPLEKASKNEALKRMENAIESLPTKEKIIIKLNILHDKKYSEIAKMLRLPDGTVSSCVKRAKEKLKELLNDLQ